jgi:thimet oligopeptidase
MHSDPIASCLTASGITAHCDTHLAEARRLADELRALKDAPVEKLMWETTGAKMDEIARCCQEACSVAQLMMVAYPAQEVREAAATCEPKVDSFQTDLYFDADISGVFTRYAEKQEALSEARQRLLDYTLRDYRRNGVHLPQDRRERLRAINEELTKLGQWFERNLANATLSIMVTSQQLEGLPEAYISNHPAGEDGKIRITTDYPDFVPFMKYAKDRNAARALYTLSQNRAKEENLPLLDALLRLRKEKATLLGYSTWADYVLEPRMAKNAKTVQTFLAELHESLRERMNEEFSQIRKQFVQLGGVDDAPILASDAGYLDDLVCRNAFQLDSQALSEYFEVSRVQQGIMDMATRLYGAVFERLNTPTWHEDAIPYMVRDRDGSVLGQVYLDLYPREGKYKHAAVFGLRETKRDTDGSRVIPMAALVCNFPRTTDHGPGLLSHEEVITFFHEFGHLLHHIMSQSELASFAGTNVARDFVEAPSQMFEEWAWGRASLNTFACHYKTHELIPDALYASLIAARHFGEAIATQRQLFLATLDQTYHTSDPGFNTTSVMEELRRDYSPFAPIPNTHFQATFGHLVGYDAAYYGYQWALSIARDLLTRFENEGMMNETTAADYRTAILEPGASIAEEKSIEKFLGRPSSPDAYLRFLGVTHE